MSAADRMVVRTRDGAYRSVPRRTGLGMISRGQAEAATTPAPPVAADVDPLGPHGDEYQTPTAEQAHAQLAHAMGVPVEVITPTALDNPYRHPLEGVDPVDLLPEFQAERGPVEFPITRELPAEPRGNASRAEWAEYAISLGVDVTDGMSRNKIRDAAQDAAQSLDRLPQPALTGGRLETPEDEPAAERLADDEDPGTE